MEAICQMTSYERALRSRSGVEGSKGEVESRTSSLSMRGHRNTLAMDWASVLLPEPG